MLFGSRKPASPAKPEYKWPECAPGTTGALSGNGIPYHPQEIEPGRWEWRVYEAAMKYNALAEARRRHIWDALQTRALTDEELLVALRYGDRLNVELGVAYHPDSQRRALDNAFQQQEVLRRIATRRERLSEFGVDTERELAGC